jgi:FAD/FMN-containing dehydrogenase/Fe-S oxidoreductase
MATEQGDPAADARADYDYQSDEAARPAFAEALAERVDCDVRFDSYSRQLYATDASAYEVTPVGVVLPRSTANVAATVQFCAARGVPVLPRGGGTSLAGQAVNEAVVLDFTRYMDGVVDVDPEAGTATAQPGVRLGDLDAELAPHGLKFAPDPAWGDKSALGGAIGNNSTGAHSLKYGKTDAYLESCEVVLADGSVTTFGEVTPAELRERGDPDGDLEARIYAEVARIVDEEADEVRDRYPDLKRNVSGYNLDAVVGDAEDGTVNLAKLLAGSEGTLAVVTEATVSLEPVPPEKSMALLAYEDVLDATEDVAAILDHDPAAVELIDDVLLDLAGDTEEFGDLVAETVPEGTGGVLLVECYADDDADGHGKVADLLDDRLPDADTEVPPPGDVATGEPTRAFAAREAHADAERERFWKLRKSGLPILLSRTTDAKHVSFIEDCAVPPEHLPEYVAGIREILADEDTFASFYAHAGPGVLHVRPLVNTKTEMGLEQMRSVADHVTDLVVDLGGSVSGEHGDGRARTEWNRKLYGDHLWGVFRGLKTTFDPDWLLNPGQVCGDVALDEDLRFDPGYEFDAGFEPSLRWENDNGLQGMVEVCHGCGGCRGPQATTGGVMCPTYRAAEEESLSTRGRANALRQAMSGDLGVATATTSERGASPAERPGEQFDPEFAAEIMDLCIGCKGCARDCPSEVDMAKLKAEIEHVHHQRHGASARERLFRDVDRVAAVGSALAPVSNWLPKLPGARLALEKTLGIARDRKLPSFARESLVDWFEARGPGLPARDADRRALLVPDPYTNYVDPAIGRAAVRVLEAAGVHVALAPVSDTGRPAHSMGFLDAARDRARAAVDALAPLVADGWDVVVAEPSDAVMVQHDYHDLLSGDAVHRVSAATYGVMEYIDRFDLDPGAAADDAHLTYHGHCHQKATSRDGHAAAVLRAAGYRVDHLDSGCCGMAGSFGYEAEHASMSRAIADVLYEQVADSPGEVVVAPGASCRSQLSEWTGDRPPHPVEMVAAALRD